MMARPAQAECQIAGEHHGHDGAADDGVVFYSAMVDALLATALAGGVLLLARRYRLFTGFEKCLLLVIWLLNGRAIGFSTSDRILRGERANMHLHIVEPDLRVQGLGTQCVKHSVDIYFELLKIKKLFCEPNAFNAAPNRTLQKAGFKFVKTHMTVPGPQNYHQAVTQWVIER